MNPSSGTSPPSVRGPFEITPTGREHLTAGLRPWITLGQPGGSPGDYRPGEGRITQVPRCQEISRSGSSRNQAGAAPDGQSLHPPAAHPGMQGWDGCCSELEPQAPQDSCTHSPFPVCALRPSTASSPSALSPGLQPSISRMRPAWRGSTK